MSMQGEVKEPKQGVDACRGVTLRVVVYISNPTIESFCKRTDLGSLPDPDIRATSSLLVFTRSGPGR